MWPLNYRHILASVIRWRTKWVAPSKRCRTFLCIGSTGIGSIGTKFTRALPPARKMKLLSSNLNMQNSVVMFTFSNFDSKYHFWVILVQKIKNVGLLWNLVPELIRICRIQWHEFNSGFNVQFFCFLWELPFLSKFGWTNQKFPFKLKFDTLTNSNTQNLMARFI